MEAEDKSGIFSSICYKDIVVESLVLSLIHSWMQNADRDAVHKIAKHTFSLADVKDAVAILAIVGHKFVDRLGGEIRSKMDLYLDDVLTVLYGLNDCDNLPSFIVSSLQLAKLAKLPILPMHSKKNKIKKESEGPEFLNDPMDVVISMTCSDMSSAISVKDTAPFGICSNRWNDAPQSLINHISSASSTKNKEETNLKKSQHKLYLKSRKIPRTHNRSNLKAKEYGRLRAGSGKFVASFNMFVGRTHPETTENDIRQLVVKNTVTGEKDGVKLENVECISEMKDDNGKTVSKGWQLSLNYNDKERMMKESSWPAGWTFRQYFPPRA